MPLPIPPVYPRRRSISSSASASSPRSPKPKHAKLQAEVSTESFVSSLQDIIVVGSPSKRHTHSDFHWSEASSSRDTLDRPSPSKTHKTQMTRSCIDLPSPSSTSPGQMRRRSDCPTGYFSGTSSASGRSLLKSRSRSPSRRPFTADDLPPVPPLPPVRQEFKTKSFVSKKLPQIRIPELGLGLEEKFRSPLSPNPLSSCRKRRGKDKEAKEETSFLDLSPRREEKRVSVNAPPRSSSSVRATPSLPDIKAMKRRSSSITDRLLKFGVPQAVH